MVGYPDLFVKNKKYETLKITLHSKVMMIYLPQPGDALWYMDKLENNYFIMN